MITDPPSTSFTTLSNLFSGYKKRRKKMWHVRHDMWHMTHSVGWTFSQNFSSLPLSVWDWQCFEYISTNPDLPYLLSNKAVCRTAPATPGLLKKYIYDSLCFLQLGGWPFSGTCEGVGAEEHTGRHTDIATFRLNSLFRWKEGCPMVTITKEVSISKIVKSVEVGSSANGLTKST